MIELGAERIECGASGLKILAAFIRPQPMSEALATLQQESGGAQQWIDLTSMIVRLHEVGVLRDQAQHHQRRGGSPPVLTPRRCISRCWTIGLAPRASLPRSVRS